MTQDEIRDFLYLNGLSYKWLAAKLDLAPGTVRNWFSRGHRVPRQHGFRIEQILMEEQRQKLYSPLSAGRNIIAFWVDDEVFGLARARAVASGCAIEDFARRCLLYALGVEP